jgi:hypothetical protein
VNRETAERCTILRGLVGSTVHGLNVNDGIEDRDEMGICVEPLEEAMALWAPFEQFIYRTAAEREGRDNARSTAGDLDLTIYSLRKWTRLALKGNPTIMLLLFTPEDQLVYCDTLGAELRALTPSIVSRRVQGPFLGYLQAQKQRLTGERGQKRIHRPELEEMYGFDTKYAPAHAATRFSRRRVANDRPSEPSDAGTSTFFPARRTSRESQRAGLPHASRRIGARACRP